LKQQSTQQKTKKIAVTGIGAAVIFAITFFLRIPVPIPGGAYINLGDSAIFIVAFLTAGRASRESRPKVNSVPNEPRDTPAGAPLPAAVAAAVGSAFADLAAGAPLYIPATFIIKGVMGFLFGKICEKAENFKMFICAAALCGLVMIIGYGIYETAVFSLAYALSSLPFNIIQAVGSVAVSAVMYKPVLNVKKRHFDF
jgi:uncharacterized membrane protein